MGNTLSYNVGVANKLQLAVEHRNSTAVLQIVQQYPRVVTTPHGKAAAKMALGKGDCESLRVLLTSFEEAEGRVRLREFVNSGARRGRSFLMTLASGDGDMQREHWQSVGECIAYLLALGANPLAQTSRGETCLHLAARSDNAVCLRWLLSTGASVGQRSGQLATVVITTVRGQKARYVDFPTYKGMTPLMTAAKKGSPNAMRVLLAYGARLDAVLPVLPRFPRPQPAWLAPGSTALHIAAGTGHASCASILLDAQGSSAGLPLEGIRNWRGLTAMDVSSARPADMTFSVLSRAQTPRRQLRPVVLSQQRFVDPDILLVALVKRAGLLLSLRTIALDRAAKVAARETPADEECEDLATTVGHVAEIWGRVGAPAAELLTSLRTCLALLNGSLGLPTGLTQDSSPRSDAGCGSEASEGAAQKLGRSSMAAAALVQAALNAMATATPAHAPVDTPLSELTPTTPIAAAMVLQAVVRTLSASPREVLQAVTSLATTEDSLTGINAEDGTTPAQTTAPGVARPDDNGLEGVSVLAVDARTETLVRRVHAQGQDPRSALPPAMQRTLSAPARPRPAALGFRSRTVTELRRSLVAATLVAGVMASPRARTSPRSPPAASGCRSVASTSPGLNRARSMPSSGQSRSPEAQQMANALPAPLSATSSGSDWLRRSSTARVDLTPAPSSPTPTPSPPAPHHFLGSGAAAAPHPPPLVQEEYDEDDVNDCDILSSQTSSGSTGLGADGEALPGGQAQGGAEEPAVASNATLDVDVDGVGLRHTTPLRTASADQWLRRTTLGMRVDLAGSPALPRHEQDHPPDCRKGDRPGEGQFLTGWSTAVGDSSSSTEPVDSIASCSQDDGAVGRASGYAPASTPLCSPFANGCCQDESGSSDWHDHAQVGLHQSGAADACCSLQPSSSEGRLDVEAEWQSVNEDCQGAGSEASAPGVSGNLCAICCDAALEVMVAACGHELCIGCAYQMCARGLKLPVCPFCRGPIDVYVDIGTPGLRVTRHEESVDLVDAFQ